MVRKLIGMTAPVVIVLAVLWWKPWMNRDEAAIRILFKQVCEHFEKSAPESLLVAAGKARALSECAAEEINFDTSVSWFDGTFRRTELAAQFARLRTFTQQLSLELEDVEIVVRHGSAKAAMTAEVTGQASGERVHSLYQLDLELKKTEEGWRVTRVTEIPVLQLPW